MFTGIIETIGTIKGIGARGNYKIIAIEAPGIATGIAEGDSISVDGCCLTVTRSGANNFTVEASPESIDKTIVGGYKKGTKVNLERALLPTSRMGGHIVTGHVDGKGMIDKVSLNSDILELSVNYPEEFEDFIIEKGSIALNGISLTVNSIKQGIFSVNLIPFTRNMTTVNMFRGGDKVNLEFDIIGKYIAKFMIKGKKSNLTIEKLINSGW